MRGLYAPPRRKRAPASRTARAAASVCSRVSTAHGPAITPNVPPPMRDGFPSGPGSDTTVSCGCVSRDTSFHGLEIATASVTPAKCAKWPGSTGPGLPVIATAMRCAPGILCGVKPSSRILSTTRWTSSSVAVGSIKTSMAEG